MALVTASEAAKAQIWKLLTRRIVIWRWYSELVLYLSSLEQDAIEGESPVWYW